MPSVAHKKQVQTIVQLQNCLKTAKNVILNGCHDVTLVVSIGLALIPDVSTQLSCS